MEGQVQTIIVPDGFELKNVGNNQYAVVPKQSTYADPTPSTPQRNSFFRETPESREDYDFADRDRELLTSRNRDDIFDRRYNGDNNFLHELYKQGKIKKLDRYEMDLLKFCNGINVREFIKEEFDRHPIILKKDDNGYMYAEAPNGIYDD